MRLLENGTMNGSVDRLGEYGIECLGIFNCVIVITSGDCVLNVGRGDCLIFSENIAIGIYSGRYRGDAVRRGGVPF